MGHYLTCLGEGRVGLADGKMVAIRTTTVAHNVHVVRGGQGSDTEELC